jgi:hypothetical protein
MCIAPSFHVVNAIQVVQIGVSFEPGDVLIQPGNEFADAIGFRHDIYPCTGQPAAAKGKGSIPSAGRPFNR